MSEIDIDYVLLYRTRDRWRINVTEAPKAIACGYLPGTPADAPVEVAQQELLEHLREHWNFTGQLAWRRPVRTTIGWFLKPSG
jgi:hypothetical protein